MLIQNTEDKTYVILGMHRSATSLVAKALSSIGVYMGDDLQRDVFEDTHFVDMNQKILAQAGGDWYNLPPVERVLEVGKRQSTEIEDIVQSHHGRKWGWKDPRTSITFPLWEPYLRGDVYLFCCFRRPRLVAESIVMRDSKPYAEARELCNKYNSCILNSVRRFVEL